MIRHETIRVNNFILHLSLPPPPIDPLRCTYQQQMNEEVIEYLGEFLHINDAICSLCNRRMHLQKRKKRIDQYELRCGRCGQRRSIRHGSFFAHHKKIPIPTIFQIIRNLYEVRKQSDIAKETGISEQSITVLHKEYSEMVRHYNDNHPIHFFVDDIVEIDEKKLKWYSGLRDPDPNALVVQGEWVIGLTGRNSKKVYMVPIIDRSHQSVLPVIMNRIDEGATVVTDKLSSYDALKDVYHEKYFCINKEQDGFARTDEETGLRVHVNTIEGEWQKIESHLSLHHGVYGDRVGYLLHEYMFVKNNCNFLDLLKY